MEDWRSDAATASIHNDLVACRRRTADVSSSISVVVPAYNEEAYLPGCLEALLAHSARLAKEIIVVDNGSTDSTRDVIMTYPTIGYAFEPQKGITWARQRGLDVSTGDILAFVDADTRPPAGWIERIAELFVDDPNLACVSGPYSFYDLAGARSWIARSWFVVARPLQWLNGCLMVGGNFAIRRRVMEEMGGFDRSIAFYGEDVDIARRARLHGRTRFVTDLVMPTSGRRMARQGFVRTAATYAANYVSMMTRGRPATLDYVDIR